jgi:subtilisin-like proprotein convertase family protein/uncharacterized protein YaiE (UPF0345 family)
MKQLITLLAVLFSATANAQNVGIGTTTPTDQLHTTGSVRFQKYTGPTTRLAQIDSSGRLVATAAGAVFSNTSPQAISDNGCATGVGIASSITITGQPNVPIQSSRIAVKVNITHPFVGDLKIYLFPPSINVITLANGNGGNGDNFINAIFSDEAPSSISAGGPPFSGYYKPIGGVASCNIPNTAVNTFSAFGSGSILPNGTWTLKVFDAANGDVGILNDWSISFTGPESITTADENNYIPKLVGGNLMASNIYQPLGSSKIGIGTITPDDPLTVFTPTNSNGFTHTDGTVKLGSYINSGVGYLGTGSNHNLYFMTNTLPKMSILQNGNVGIGDLNPADKLTILTASGVAGLSHTNGIVNLKTIVNVSGGFMGTMSNHPFSLMAAGTSNLTLLQNGNVGVGVANPNYILDINGRLRLRHNGATAGMWYNKADNTEAAFVGMFNDSTLGFYGTNGWTSGFDVKNGQLGIGTLDPNAPLSFANSIGNKINLFGDATTDHYGLGIQGSLLQMYSNNSSADIAFGYGRSASFTETMRIKGAGRVGINTDPTSYTLDVKNIGFGSNTLQLQSAANLGNNIENKLTFKSNNYFTGSIKTIGTSATTARIGFFTEADASEANLLERMTIDNNGNVGIGTLAPNYPLHVENMTSTVGDRLLTFIRNNNGISGNYSFVELANNKAASNFGPSQSVGVRGYASSANSNTGVSGFAQCSAGQTAYGIAGSSLTIGGGTSYAGYFTGNVNYTGSLTNTSDATLKTNIKPFENALKSINKLKIKQYEYTADSKKTMGTAEGEHIGVLAQELQQVFPTLVSKQVQPIYENVKDEKGVEKRTQTGTKEYLGVNYMELIPVLIKGMQEQQAQIEELKKKIEVLEKK